MAKAALIETADTTGQGTGVQRVTAGPERLLLFLKDVRQEMRKVVTPSRAEVQSGTIVVVVCVFFFAAYFALIDLFLGSTLDKFFVHLTKH